MEIIIGRDQNTRQLSIVKDGMSKSFGQPGSVPMDVSRHHISLQPLGSGRWQIKNLNESNVTFVNGIAVESKIISEGDRIELGNSHYLFSWAALQEPKVETVDISPLRWVWQEYNTANIAIKKRQKDISLLASIPMGITMLGGLLSSLVPEYLKPFAYVFTAIALIVMVYGFYRRFTDSSIDDQETIKKRFQQQYVCPKCGHFMGFTDYDILIQNDVCPYCRRMILK